MKTLFDKNWRYKPDGVSAAQNVQRVINETFQEYIEKGYSPREICYIIQMEANSISLEYVLSKPHEKVDEEN